MNKSILLWGAPHCVPNNIPLTEQYAQSGNNFGNILIGYGALRLFPDGRVTFRTDFKSVAEINEKCSHVVIPAANLLWKGFDLSSMLDFLQQLTLPIVMIGVGAQSSDRNIASPVHPGTVALMRYISDRCYSIGVRGYYTAEVLASIGIHNTTVVGCPSLYMKRTTQDNISAPHSGSFHSLSVNFSRRVNGHSFNPAASKHLDNILLQLAMENAADFVAQDELEELSYSLELSSDTSAFCKYFELAAPKQVAAFFKQRTNHFTNVPAWSTFLTTRTLSIGSRFHGNLLALLNDTPAYFITHDSRTLELCTLLGVPHLNVADPTTARIDQKSLMALTTAASYEAFHKSHAALFTRMKLFLHQNELPCAF
jgi:hypothetical protein